MYICVLSLSSIIKLVYFDNVLTAKAVKARRVEQDNGFSSAQSTLSDGWLFPFAVALQVSLQQ